MSKRDELAAVLGEHEARWTTYGNVRLYDVMHCVSPDCDWSLRQKALMSDEDCYEAHRAHQADAVLAWLGGQFDEGLREAVKDRVIETRDAYPRRPDDAPSSEVADAALAVVRAHLGLDGAATDAQDGPGGDGSAGVGQESTASPVGRENDTSEIQGEA